MGAEGEVDGLKHGRLTFDTIHTKLTLDSAMNGNNQQRNADYKIVTFS